MRKYNLIELNLNTMRNMQTILSFNISNYYNYKIFDIMYNFTREVKINSK